MWKKVGSGNVQKPPLNYKGNINWLMQLVWLPLLCVLIEIDTY